MRDKYPWAYQSLRTEASGMREAVSRVWFMNHSDVKSYYDSMVDKSPKYDSFSNAVRLRINNKDLFDKLTDILCLVKKN